MCYSNCPYENYHGDCRKVQTITPSDAHCFIPTCEQCGREEELKDDLCEDCRKEAGYEDEEE